MLINLRSRRGSEETADLVRSLLPKARIALTRTLDEARAWLRDTVAPHPPRVLLSGGGDGTAVNVLTEMRALGVRVGAFGVLPLGTGNAWAHEMRTPAVATAVRRIAALGDVAPPVRAFRMIEVEGRLTPFAGSGWDAEIVADYQRMVAEHGNLESQTKAGVLGYMRSLFTRTIPNQMRGNGAPRVRLVSLDDEPRVIDRHGKPVRIEGAGHGTVLYEGPGSVAGCGTTSTLGLGMKVFPFVGAMPGRMEVRIYAASVLEATLNIPNIWRGAHPLALDHHWLLRRCRMEYDREVQVEIGGDVIGPRRSVEYAVADEQVPTIDWSSFAAPRLAARA